MNKLPGTLNPTEEQKTFEMLVMGKEEFDQLEFIRRHMRHIISERQAHGRPRENTQE